MCPTDDYSPVTQETIACHAIASCLWCPSMAPRRHPQVSYGSGARRVRKVDGRTSVEGSYWHAEVEVPFRDDWFVYGYFVESETGGPMLAEIRVFPAQVKDEKGRGLPIGRWSGHPSAVDHLESGLTARLLRTVSIRQLESKLQDELSRQDPDEPLLGPMARGARKALLPERTGRAGREDSYYAQWAAHYVEQIRGGNTKPIATLAKRFNLKESQVRDLVRRARERELLTAGSQGRPGGELTDKGRSALNSKDN
jgi:hypothetical protein